MENNDMARIAYKQMLASRVGLLVSGFVGGMNGRLTEEANRRFYFSLRSKGCTYLIMYARKDHSARSNYEKEKMRLALMYKCSALGRWYCSASREVVLVLLLVVLVVIAHQGKNVSKLTEPANLKVCSVRLKRSDRGSLYRDCSSFLDEPRLRSDNAST